MSWDWDSFFKSLQESLGMSQNYFMNQVQRKQEMEDYLKRTTEAEKIRHGFESEREREKQRWLDTTSQREGFESEYGKNPELYQTFKENPTNWVIFQGIQKDLKQEKPLTEKQRSLLSTFPISIQGNLMTQDYKNQLAREERTLKVEHEKATIENLKDLKNYRKELGERSKIAKIEREEQSKIAKMERETEEVKAGMEADQKARTARKETLTQRMRSAENSVANLVTEKFLGKKTPEQQTAIDAQIKIIQKQRAIDEKELVRINQLENRFMTARIARRRAKAAGRTDLFPEDNENIPLSDINETVNTIEGTGGEQPQIMLTPAEQADLRAYLESNKTMNPQEALYTWLLQNGKIQR